MFFKDISTDACKKPFQENICKGLVSILNLKLNFVHETAKKQIIIIVFFVITIQKSKIIKLNLITETRLTKDNAIKEFKIGCFEK